MQNDCMSHHARAKKKRKGKNLPTGANVTTEIFEFDCLPVKIIAAATSDQRGGPMAVDLCVITAQS